MTQTPPPMPPQVPPSAAGAVVQYSHKPAPTMLAAWAMGLVAATGFSNACSGVLLFALKDTVARLNSGAEPSNEDAVAALALLGVGCGTFAVYIAAAVLFAVWFYRTVWNAKCTDPTNKQLSPGLAAGGFFIPFANLVIPIMQALAARRVYEAALAQRGGANVLPSVGLLGGWWALWIISNIVSSVSRITDSLGAAPEIGAACDAAGGVLSLAAAVVCILVIRAFTATQTVMLGGAPQPAMMDFAPRA